VRVKAEEINSWQEANSEVTVKIRKEKHSFSCF